ncbi:MAG: hypothetical protein HN352_10490 [Bacteroidetes bacterium]|jgi:hypothetical protein|nr:hypothetical protein [Bacteroidota bacterium]MBT3750478.1 hypothetical protein [Bacteroidota bacterium]MBT4398487.1 hypothetical protein [Bacteroidota bacterium]MBT4409218.1 hypothetical protein [Bacteroidota bacterium]MBT5427586.1 hypothetical protein [Bacteroidota bacterium]
MKKIIQYTTYFIPLIFAAICLAWFCKVYNPTMPELKKADYANQGSLKIAPAAVHLLGCDK